MLSEQDARKLKAYLRKRDALFRKPTLSGATKLIREWEPDIKFLDPLLPLSALHKARLQWLDATDDMIEESLTWLKEHNYENTMKGAPPFTPDQRDAERANYGLPPLKKVVQ